MKLIFSDLHANKKAAKDIQKLAKCVTELIFCGDICGYGKYYKYCIDMFKDLNVKAVLGNHDYLVIQKDISLDDYQKEVASPIEQTRRLIKKAEAEYLRSLPLEIMIDDMYVTHTYNLDYYIRTKEDCKLLFKKTKAKTIAIGHTHMQAEYFIDGVHVINPGSITKGRADSSRGYALLNDDNTVRLVKMGDL